MSVAAALYQIAGQVIIPVPHFIQYKERTRKSCECIYGTAIILIDIQSVWIKYLTDIGLGTHHYRSSIPVDNHIIKDTSGISCSRFHGLHISDTAYLPAHILTAFECQYLLRTGAIQ